MPAKKRHDDRPSPTPIPDDPNTLAQREAQEKKNHEACNSLEQEELLVRLRVEAMEKVEYKIILAEKEKRLDPEGWQRKMQIARGPFHVHVKLLTGNRAVPQLNLRIVLPDENATVLMLKTFIRDEALRLGHSPARFAPSCQTLYAFGKAIETEDEHSATLRSLQISNGSSLQLSLAVRPDQALPSQISKKPLPVKAH